MAAAAAFKLGHRRGLTSLDRLNAELRAVVAMPEMRDTFDREGADPASMSAAEAHAFYRADIEKWRVIARARNISVD